MSLTIHQVTKFMPGKELNESYFLGTHTDFVPYELNSQVVWDCSTTIGSLIDTTIGSLAVTDYLAFWFPFGTQITERVSIDYLDLAADEVRQTPAFCFSLNYPLPLPLSPPPSAPP